MAARDVNFSWCCWGNHDLNIYQPINIVFTQSGIPYGHNGRHKVSADVIGPPHSNTRRQRYAAADNFADLMHGDGNWKGPRSDIAGNCSWCSISHAKAITAKAQGQFGRLPFFNPPMARKSAVISEPTIGAEIGAWVVAVSGVKTSIVAETVVLLVVRSLGRATGIWLTNASRWHSAF